MFQVANIFLCCALALCLMREFDRVERLSLDVVLLAACCIVGIILPVLK